jgi:hypothetical protein
MEGGGGVNPLADEEKGRSDCEHGPFHIFFRTGAGSFHQFGGDISNHCQQLSIPMEGEVERRIEIRTGRRKGGQETCKLRSLVKIFYSFARHCKMTDNR